MKKLALLLLLPLLLPGCSDDEERAGQPAAGEKMLLKASVVTEAGNEAAKTALGASNTVLWQSGDAISILTPHGTLVNESFELAQGAGTTSGAFSGRAFNTSSGYWAVYPYKIGNAVAGGGVKVPLFNGVQTAVRGGFDPEYALMVGYSRAGSVAFRQMLAYIKFTVDFPCSQVVFESTDSNVILNSSQLYIWPDANGIPYIDQVSAPMAGDGHRIVLQAAQGSMEPGTYLMAVVPATLGQGFSIRFKTSADADKDVVSKSTSKSVTLSRGQILNLGTVSASDYTPYNHPDNLWLGDGTAAYPYLLTTAGQLDDLSAQISAGNDCNKYFRLTKDIDKQGSSLCFGGAYPFTGNFNGGGHAISNVRLGEWTDNSFYGGSLSLQGIFPRVHNATITGLHIVLDNTDVNIGHAAQCANMVAGGIVGYADSDESKYTTITGCSFSVGTPQPEDWDIRIQNKERLIWGGIIGAVTGNLHCNGNTTSANVRLTGDIDNPGNDHVSGGIIGKVSATRGFDIRVYVDRCRNASDLLVFDVRQKPAIAGGIIGHVDEGVSTDETRLKMTNCVNEGSVAASGIVDDEDKTDAYSGGLVGWHDSDGSYGEDPYIVNCLNKGAVETYGDDGYAGGLIGCCYDDDTQIVNCANVGPVTGRGDTETGQWTGDGDGTFTNCASGNAVTPATMNAHKPSPDYDGVSMASWTGSGSGDIDLDI